MSPRSIEGHGRECFGGNRARIGDLERPLSGGQTRADEGPLLAYFVEKLDGNLAQFDPQEAAGSTRSWILMR